MLLSTLQVYLLLATFVESLNPAMVADERKNLKKAVDYRPAIHFSPTEGFMNDPNGLIHDKDTGKYHLYYQYNPNDTIAGNQHWGHASSPDLLHWQDHPIAISPTANGGAAFSGTIVNDINNTSGLFSQKGTTNFVAIFTRAYPDRQEQVIMYSTDEGISFKEYENNPVLNLNMSNFRDPQVQWLEHQRKWVMTVAISREHLIRFYESKDLKNWNRLSDFQGGIFGVDYECPSLVPVLDENNNTRWVLFISINPGMPLGGSGTQYFVGDFNGTTFVPDKNQQSATLMVDIAKDNYALQYINPGATGDPNATGNSSIPAESSYIGWFGNWQYCQETPTESWRSAMTLARNLSLKKDWLGITRLVQSPRNIEKIRTKVSLTASFNLTSKKSSTVLDLFQENSTAVEIIVKGQFRDLNRTYRPGAQRVFIDMYNDKNETLQVGIDALSCIVWVDRGRTRGFENPFFTDKFSAAVALPSGSFEWRIILDASLLELYTEEGFTVASVVYYPTAPLTKAILRIPGEGAVDAAVTINPLKKTMDRKTLHE